MFKAQFGMSHGNVICFFSSFFVISSLFVMLICPKMKNAFEWPVVNYGQNSMKRLFGQQANMRASENINILATWSTEKVTVWFDGSTDYSSI